MTASSAGCHVYHIGPWRRWVPVWIFGPILLGTLGLWICLPSKDRAVAGYFLAALLPFALGMQWLIDRARLEISPEGVRLRQTGYRLETPWANIVDLLLEHGREGFVTREPVGGQGQELLAATAGMGVAFTPIYDDRHRALLGEHRLIPFEAFAWHLRHGPLRSEIEEYAPHLRPALAALDHPQPKSPTTQTRLQPLKRRDWLVLLGIAAFLGAIIWLASRSEASSRLVEYALGSLGIAAFAFHILYSGQEFFRRRLWIFGGAFLLVGSGLALWAMAMAMEFIQALGLGPKPKAALGLTFFAALTLISSRGTRNAFRRKSIFVGILLLLLDLFLAMMTLGLWIEFSKS